MISCSIFAYDSRLLKTPSVWFSGEGPVGLERSLGQLQDSEKGRGRWQTVTAREDRQAFC